MENNLFKEFLRGSLLVSMKLSGFQELDLPLYPPLYPQLSLLFLRYSIIGFYLSFLFFWIISWVKDHVNDCHTLTTLSLISDELA